MIAAVRFDPAHLAAFAPAAPFRHDGLDAGEMAARAAASAAAGPAWSLLHEGRPVGCGGVAVLWPGVGEAWSLSAPDLGALALALTRLSAALLDAAAARHRLHRIQAAVHIDNGSGRRWLARLGFEEEGLMRGYGPQGDDFIRMARGGTTWPTR